MIDRYEVVAYLNDLLQIDAFRDYCPNGLQVEGSAVIKKVICGVTASQALIDAAIIEKADTIIVHHGLFWKGDDYQVTSYKKKRLKALLAHDINLLAYHLPLDCHVEYGNNPQLGKQLQLHNCCAVEVDGIPQLLWYSQLDEGFTNLELKARLTAALSQTPLHISKHKERTIKKIAWCTGGAQKYLEKAAALGADAYITGEASEQTTHLARELNVDFFAAGHHATERYGVKSLAKHLEEHFGLSCKFVDIDNPV